MRSRFGYHQAWHQLKRVLFPFFMTKSERKRWRKRRCRKTNKKNEAKHKVSSSKFTHFPRICFVRSAYYSHKFRQLQMAQPLNRIDFTKNHEFWCILCTIKTQHFINLSNIWLILKALDTFNTLVFVHLVCLIWTCVIVSISRNMTGRPNFRRVLRIYSFTRIHFSFPFVYPYSHEIAWIAKISYDGFCMRKDVNRQEFAWTEKSR